MFLHDFHVDRLIKGAARVTESINNFKATVARECANPHVKRSPTVRNSTVLRWRHTCPSRSVAASWRVC